MKKISRIYLGLIFLLLYLPIFYLIAYAFNAGGDMNAFTGLPWSISKVSLRIRVSC